MKSHMVPLGIKKGNAPSVSRLRESWEEQMMTEVQIVRSGW